MATLINIGNNIKVNPKFISYFEGLEIVLANKHRFTVSADVIELVKAYVENRNTGALHYKGKVSSVSNLPSTGNIDGDMYLVTGEDKYYAWNGTSWDDTPTIVNISSFETSLDTEATARQQADASLQSAIAAEAARATGKEQELDAKIQHVIAKTSVFVNQNGGFTKTTVAESIVTSDTIYLLISADGTIKDSEKTILINCRKNGSNIKSIYVNFNEYYEHIAEDSYDSFQIYAPAGRFTGFEGQEFSFSVEKTSLSQDIRGLKKVHLKVYPKYRASVQV